MEGLTHIADIVVLRHATIGHVAKPVARLSMQVEGLVHLANIKFHILLRLVYIYSNHPQLCKHCRTQRRPKLVVCLSFEHAGGGPGAHS